MSRWENHTAEDKARNKAARKSRYYQRHKEEIRARKQGLTAAEVQRMTDEQGGVCAICKGPGPLVVDHDHAHCPGPRSCGECVRGLLCHACNKVLGFVRDNSDRLNAAAVYLREGLVNAILGPQHDN